MSSIPPSTDRVPGRRIVDSIVDDLGAERDGLNVVERHTKATIRKPTERHTKATIKKSSKKSSSKGSKGGKK